MLKILHQFLGPAEENIDSYIGLNYFFEIEQNTSPAQPQLFETWKNSKQIEKPLIQAVIGAFLFKLTNDVTIWFSRQKHIVTELYLLVFLDISHYSSVQF